MSLFSQWAKSPPLDAEAVVAEFVAFAREQAPDAQLHVADDGALKIQSDALDIKEQTMYLGKLLHETSEIPANQPLMRRSVYTKWWGVVSNAHKEVGDAYEGGFEAVRERIFPKIVQPGFMDRAVEMGMERNSIPHFPLGSTPFFVVFVVDFPDRVSYILAPQAEQLGVDADTLRAAAWDNTRRLWTREEVRPLIEGGAAVAVHCAEGHNSARAALLPEYLEEGEEIAFLILDRDRLMLMPAPPDNNWNPLRSVCRDPYGLPRPLRITRDGIAAM